MRRYICLLLTICLFFSFTTAKAEFLNDIGSWFSDAWEDTTDWVEQAVEDTGEWVSNAADDVGEWVSNAAEDTGKWVSQAASDAWEWTKNAGSDAWNWTQNAGTDAWNWSVQAAKDTSGWVVQAWDDSTVWVSHAWDNTSEWTAQAWNDASMWTARAWDDSTNWVSNAWRDSTNWVAVNWDNFILWINKQLSGDPYAWIVESVVDNGEYAYDQYVAIRTFVFNYPDIEEIHNRYNLMLSDLSIVDEESEVIWNTVQDWSDKKSIPMKKTTLLALPFLTRLLIEGESAIGEGVEFSGPVLTQYLITVLDALNLNSDGDTDIRMVLMRSALDSLTRPVIIGDTDQNVFVTNDHTYIENFTYGDGKYQLLLVATMKNEQSQYPMINGEAIDQITQNYFPEVEISEAVKQETINEKPALISSFTETNSEKNISGETIAVWGEKNVYLFFILTEQEWNDEEINEWLSSVLFADDINVSFAVDMESDGAFYGVNQGAQKYTINRIFDEQKFLVPKTGHGWAAERGNNLIDNIKGIFKRYHSQVIGDDNAKNWADRKVTYNDGTTLLIQTKYYKSASQSIAACFEEGQFRYFDADGVPMAIEVPRDQYDQAINYMKNRIANGEVNGITDVNEAYNIVKKGSLSYNQAKHLAKAGTVESILYDSYHACISAGSSMGLSAISSFAIDIWNGEPVETAIMESIYTGLQSGGTSFIISVLSSQLAKTGLSKALVPASKVIVSKLGPRVSAAIINAFRPAGSAIYGAAAMQSAAKLLRGNIITSAVAIVVLSAGDVADIIQNKISLKQLAKNLATTTVSVASGAAGYVAGAAIGTAIFPGVGTAAGIIFGLVLGSAAGWGAGEGAKALGNLIAEDDAVEMCRIIEEQFIEIAEEYFITEDELNQAVDNLQGFLSSEMLKQMYQYRDHKAFARQLIEMSIDPVVAKRAFVKLPSEEEYADYLTETLESIYEEIGDEPVTEGV